MKKITAGRAAVTATFGPADTVPYGRKTYDSFAGAWPGREEANRQLEITWRSSYAEAAASVPQEEQL